MSNETLLDDINRLRQELGELRQWRIQNTGPVKRNEFGGVVAYAVGYLLLDGDGRTASEALTQRELNILLRGSQYALVEQKVKRIKEKP